MGIMNRACVNHMMNQSIHRDSVWVRAFKQDAEEDRVLVLQNEWVKKKWALFHPGMEVKSGSAENVVE